MELLSILKFLKTLFCSKINELRIIKVKDKIGQTINQSHITKEPNSPAVPIPFIFLEKEVTHREDMLLSYCRSHRLKSWVFLTIPISQTTLPNSNADFGSVKVNSSNRVPFSFYYCVAIVEQRFSDCIEY